MAPSIRDGVYRIRNVEFSHEVAGLVGGVSIGTIVGFVDRPSSPYTLWRIKNIGGDANTITMESVSNPGTFAGAYQYPGEFVSGDSDQIDWTIVKAERGYYIQSANAQLVWQLTRDGKCAPIELNPHNGKFDTQWKFERVGQLGM